MVLTYSISLLNIINIKSKFLTMTLFIDLLFLQRLKITNSSKKFSPAMINIHPSQINILNLKSISLTWLSKKEKSSLVKMSSSKFFNMSLHGFHQKSLKSFEQCPTQQVSINTFLTLLLNIVSKDKISCISSKYGNKKSTKNKRKLDKKSLKFSNLQRHLWSSMTHTLRIKSNIEILSDKCLLMTKSLNLRIMIFSSLFLELSHKELFTLFTLKISILWRLKLF